MASAQRADETSLTPDSHPGTHGNETSLVAYIVSLCESRSNRPAHFGHVSHAILSAPAANRVGPGASSPKCGGAIADRQARSAGQWILLDLSGSWDGCSPSLSPRPESTAKGELPCMRQIRTNAYIRLHAGTYSEIAMTTPTTELRLPSA